MEENKKIKRIPKQYKIGDKYEIPYEGSLALLALGHKGLKLWREKRSEVDALLAKNKASENKNKKG